MAVRVKLASILLGLKLMRQIGDNCDIHVNVTFRQFSHCSLTLDIVIRTYMQLYQRHWHESLETFVRVSHNSCETFVQVSHDVRANVAQFYFLQLSREMV